MQLDSFPTKALNDNDKEQIKTKTAILLKQIGKYQKMLYAEQKRSLLIVLQGVDASGKDGLIANVFTGMNPLGVNVSAFKAPSEKESSHDFLWRIHAECPAKGMIQIFNRSHYEDILVPVVNRTLTERQLRDRIQDINAFESLLRNSGTSILKFYLHISRDEQARRLRERKTNPAKFWKHNDDDWKQRRKWADYMKTYEMIFRKCNRPPWQIIPADQNWYKEYVAAAMIYKTLKKMKLVYPELKK